MKQTQDEKFHLTYDPLDQLVEAISEKSKISFVYDPLGRCLNKTLCHKTSNGWKEVDTENFLYDKQNEMGAFGPTNQPKNLRVLGLSNFPNHPTTIGIEVDKQVFTPIIDIQGNVRCLIDSKSKKLRQHYDFTAFGEELGEGENLNPWRFASKRLDFDLGLIYFGKRYYDPEFARWLTKDPMGIEDSINLYHYLFNNPFRYVDPDGQCPLAIPIFITLFEFALPTFTVALPTLTQIGVAVGIALIATAGYEATKLANDWDQKSINYSMSTQNAESVQTSSKISRKKKGEVDENLPDNPFDDPNLEEISHPNAKEKGRHKFKDKRTGEIIEYDKAKPGARGHEGHDHYHRPNPNETGKKDYYLDANGNPVPKGSNASHLYPPKKAWWK